MVRSSSKVVWFVSALALCSACSDDEQDGGTTGGAGGSSASNGGSTGNAGDGGSSTSTAGGAGVGGSGGSSGVGGAPVTGCATPGGVKCPTDQVCCTGVPYPAEGACYPECTLESDRAIKEGFQSVDTTTVLDRLASIEITEWSYRRDGSTVRHMGPIAQDFRQAFGLGTDGEHIHTIDGQGVTIAAVQALYDRVQQLQTDNDRLRGDQQALEARLRELERRR